jgi:hypothetical protein
MSTSMGPTEAGTPTKQLESAGLEAAGTFESLESDFQAAQEVPQELVASSSADKSLERAPPPCPHSSRR